MPTHRLIVDNWHPARLNQYLGRHWRVGHRLKKADAAVIAGEAYQQGIPRATTPRKVSFTFEVSNRGKLPDGDGFLKSALDALVTAGLLVDDGPRWCQLGTIQVRRARRKRTTIRLEDLVAQVDIHELAERIAEASATIAGVKLTRKAETELRGIAKRLEEMAKKPRKRTHH